MDPEAWNEEAVQFIQEYWELSESERQAFLQLRDALRDVDHWKNNPDVIVRFLRAKSGKVDAAEKLFREMVQWRLDNKVDTILIDYTPPKLLQDYTPGALLEGLDLEGDPIFVSRTGVTDGKGLLAKFGEDEVVKYAIWVREKIGRGQWMKEFEEKRGRPLKQLTVIEDLLGPGGLPSSQEFKMFGKVMKLDKEYYCESSKKIIGIRTPFIFRASWTIVKHFFDSQMVAKMEFSGSSGYEEVLSKYVNIETLPSELVPGVGKGDVAAGMVYNFKGGTLPKEDE